MSVRISYEQLLGLCANMEEFGRMSRGSHFVPKKFVDYEVYDVQGDIPILCYRLPNGDCAFNTLDLLYDPRFAAGFYSPAPIFGRR